MEVVDGEQLDVDARDDCFAAAGEIDAERSPTSIASTSSNRATRPFVGRMVDTMGDVPPPCEWARAESGRAGAATSE